jgi:hypothetical protein
MTPLARTVGTVLAATSLVLAFAVAAQTAAYSPSGGAPGGLLAWVFALFAGGALIAVFLFVLWIVRDPRARNPDEPPATARRRVT